MCIIHIGGRSYTEVLYPIKADTKSYADDHKIKRNIEKDVAKRHAAAPAYDDGLEPKATPENTIKIGVPSATDEHAHICI